MLSKAVGASLADRILRAGTHATTFRAATPQGTAPSPRERTAVVSFGAAPVRGEDTREVRRLAAYACAVLERLRASRNGYRAVSRALWLGHGLGKAGDYWGLAGKIGVSPRELSRYRAILTSAGILQTWQPRAQAMPASLVGRRSGHAYACYRLLGDMPRELMQRLMRWAGGAKVGAPTKADAPAPAPAPAGSRDLSVFLALIPTGPPPRTQA